MTCCLTKKYHTQRGRLSNGRACPSLPGGTSEHRWKHRAEGDLERMLRAQSSSTSTSRIHLGRKESMESVSAACQLCAEFPAMALMTHVNKLSSEAMLSGRDRAKARIFSPGSCLLLSESCFSLNFFHSQLASLPHDGGQMAAFRIISSQLRKTFNKNSFFILFRVARRMDYGDCHGPGYKTTP